MVHAESRNPKGDEVGRSGLTRRSVLAFAVAAGLRAAPATSAPRLLDLDRIQKLTRDQPWATQLLRGIIRFSDEWPAQHVREFGLKEWALPPEGAGWSHAYVCPEHGVRLNQKAGKNLCPIDGKDYHGWPIDNCVYMQRNGANASAVRDLGLTFRVTGKQEYLEKARRIVNAYSALYPTLPIHDNNNKRDTKTGARIMSQTLSEASWLTPLAYGYDLVRESLTADQRSAFETNVLRNAAAVIRRYDAGKSNWQSWHNAALLAAGLLVDNKELITLAIDGPSGFKFQAREAITPDGDWYEGSWGYHFFALNPLLQTREMALRNGIALPEADALKRMLDAPLACVFPDNTLPNFSDSNYTSITGEAHYYDIGYRIFRDPRYLAIATPAPRDIDSLLWGTDTLEGRKSEPLGSTLQESAGIAVLRVAGSDHTVAIKFGPHGSGHGHFDKLSFISYANGARQAVDPGTQAYAAKTHDTWDKMTIAHNTISVDGKVQAQATGKLLEWIVRPEMTAIRVSAGPVYAGVELERTLVHTADYTLDVFTAQATDSASHQFDWIYHNYGALRTALSLEPFQFPERTNGYQHLTKTKSVHTDAAWQADFTGMRVHVLGSDGTQVVTGEGLGPDLRVPAPFVLARRNGTSTRFLALYEPAKLVTAFSADGDRIVVQSPKWRDEISVKPGAISRQR
jgi:oligo-alginate lyase